MAAKIKKILKFVLAGAAIIILALHLFASPAPDHPFFEQFDQYPLVIAHAGSELYPTDTMYALEQYADMGVDILEMDLHMTQDGVIVLIHDDTVDRTTDGTGDIREMTITQAKSLDAGYNWTQDEGLTYPFRDMGITIPTLEEVFQAFPNYPMIIEIKQETPPMAEQLCDLIREYNMSEDVIVPSFSDIAIQEFREACPEVATAASSSEVRKFVYLNFVLMTGTISPEYFAMQVPESRDGIPIVTKLFIWAANRSNLQVQIWTINDKEDMERFIDMGVHAIMTDRTDILLELLGRE